MKIIVFDECMVKAVIMGIMPARKLYTAVIEQEKRFLTYRTWPQSIPAARKQLTHRRHAQRGGDVLGEGSKTHTQTHRQTCRQILGR